MLSINPVNLNNISGEKLDREILRLGIIAELDAVSLYEQLAAKTDNEKLKKVFLDVAKEEKEHVGEFQTLLFQIDSEQVEAFEEGKKEVEELTGE
jgi:rubrerythrin